MNDRRSLPRELMAAVKRTASTAIYCVRELLRELSDQNAYARHLRVHAREHSAEEWRRFSDERMKAKYARAKCC